MGNILSQTAITCAIGYSGEDTIAHGLTKRVALEPRTLAGAESGCVESVRGLVRFVELLPAPRPRQPHPGPGSSLPQRPFLPGPLCPMNF